MIFLRDLLNEDKKLRIFDFDDTLVKTKSHIYITHRDGKKSKLSPGEYAVYTPKQGDQFDFSDFVIILIHLNLCFFVYSFFFVFYEFNYELIVYQTFYFVFFYDSYIN